MNTTQPTLAGKSIIITGVTSGIGLAAAKEFAQQGAYVIGVGRSEERIRKAEETIKQSKPSGEISFLLADLANKEEVIKLAQAAFVLLSKHHYDHLDVLINNAGVYLENKHLNYDRIEITFAVNHLAAFGLTHQLLSHLKKAPNGRVITLSSYAHRTVPLNLNRICNPFPYIGLLAYKRSKLCNILFTNELNQRCPQIEAYAVDPGLVNTAIGSKSKPGISDWVWQRRRRRGTDTDVPVKTLLFLAAEPQIDTTHGYYFRDCRPQTPSRNARRKDLAAALWFHSCQLTGIKWD